MRGTERLKNSRLDGVEENLKKRKFDKEKQCMDIMEVRKADGCDNGGIVKDVGLNSEAFIDSRYSVTYLHPPF